MELIFVATDTIEPELLLDEDHFYRKYLEDDWGIENVNMDNEENLGKLLLFTFRKKINLIELAASSTQKLYDLTPIIDCCISFETLEEEYQEWIKQSGRENTMDEYGNLVGIIGYVNRNRHKPHLILITEK